MVPANASLTSQIAAVKASRGRETTKHDVMACFREKDIADVGKGETEVGMCDLELYIRTGATNSNHRSRREELRTDDRLLVAMNVIVLVQHSGRDHAFIKHRLRRDSDPFDVPVPQHNPKGKPRRRTHEEILVGDHGLMKEFETEAELRHFLKRHRYLPRPDENGQHVFSKRKTEIVLRYTPGPGVIRAELSLEPMPPFTGTIVYLRESLREMQIRCGHPATGRLPSPFVTPTRRTKKP